MAMHLQGFITNRNIRLPDHFSFELWIKVLLFLFPILLVSVRHWASGFFILLCLLALVAMVRQGKTFWHASRLEWILMGLIGLFFVSFLFTSLINGWDKYAVRALGTELRFLFFIPLYLMVRQVPDTVKFFALGCLLGVFVNFGLVVYEIHILGLSRSNGVYGPLFVGPVTVLLATIVLYTINIKHPLLKVLFLAAVFAATLVVAVYSSRSALLGIAVLAIFVLLSQFKRYRWLMVFTLLGVALFSLQYHETTKGRVIGAYDNFVAYLNHEVNLPNMKANPAGHTSTGTRLEMVKATLYLLAEKPVLGIGRYAYTDFVKKYVEQGLLNPAVAAHSHPHSLLFATIFFKGLVGLVIVLAIFIYGLWFFAQQSKRFAMPSYAGMTFLIGVFVVQATESAVLIKGNFIAVFLVALSVLLAYKVQAIDKHAKQGK